MSTLSDAEFEQLLADEQRVHDEIQAHRAASADAVASTGETALSRSSSTGAGAEAAAPEWPWKPAQDPFDPFASYAADAAQHAPDRIYAEPPKGEIAMSNQAEEQEQVGQEGQREYAPSLDMNSVSVVGRLTAEPELESLTNAEGNEVPHCRFRIAVNNGARPSGEPRPATFIDVDTWARLAENCAQYLDKGSKVAVNGRLNLESWQAKDGTNRSRHVIQTSSMGSVQFLTRQTELAGPEIEVPNI